MQFKCYFKEFCAEYSIYQSKMTLNLSLYISISVDIFVLISSKKNHIFENAECCLY